MTKPTQNPEIAKLVAEISRYLAKHNMTRSDFGVWALNDPNLLRDLDNGRDLRWPTIVKIRDKMDEGVAA